MSHLPQAQAQPQTQTAEAVVEQYERMRPIVNIDGTGFSATFHVPNQMTLWRVQTLMTKEPCTIAWLNQIEPGAVLLDVGANVGMYTIFAAKFRGATVYAFEPESQNFALLNANIHANGLHGQVHAFCVALSDRTGMDHLFLSCFSLGASCHSLGEEVGFDLKPRSSSFVQGVFSYTIDEAVEQGRMPVPEHIKIDVDGFEHKVIKGAEQTLRNPRVKSILIELNPGLEEHRACTDQLLALGFEFDEGQVEEAARKEGPFKGVGEWIFRRPEAPVAKASVPVDEPLVHTLRPSVVAARSAVTDQVLDHLLQRLDGTTIQAEPFPYAVVDDVLPEAYYQRAMDCFPPDSRMLPLSETGRTTGYKERLVTLFDEGGFSRLSVTQREFWSELAGWLYDPRFINGVIARFKPFIEERIHSIKDQQGRIRVCSDALIVSDKTHYTIGPHTDAAHKLISFLFYMPRDDRFRACGTTIYQPKDPTFESKDGRHHGRDRFHRLRTLDFVPNRLVIFVRTNRSFHGVEPLEDPNVERHLLINNIRLLDA